MKGQEAQSRSGKLSRTREEIYRFVSSNWRRLIPETKKVSEPKNFQNREFFLLRGLNLNYAHWIWTDTVLKMYYKLFKTVYYNLT